MDYLNLSVRFHPTSKECGVSRSHEAKILEEIKKGSDFGKRVYKQIEAVYEEVISNKKVDVDGLVAKMQEKGLL